MFSGVSLLAHRHYSRSYIRPPGKIHSDLVRVQRAAPSVIQTATAKIIS